MKTLYFDCFAGASGNMILGALVDLGVNKDELLERLKLLKLPDFKIEFTIVDRSGISGTHADVRVPREHAHRHLGDIVKIINDSDLPETIKQRSAAVFTLLAEAEAKVHGISIEKVHFHEVGAMDAIVDIVGCCIGFEILGVEKFYCSKIHVGSGFVRMAHGKFPVPPPAVAEILKNAPVYSTEIEGELMTPTGAAIIAAVAEEFGRLPEIKTEKIGYGAGTREYKDFPNVLRLIFGEVEILESKIAAKKENDRLSHSADQLYLIETNIDDLSPQILGFVMERAFETGALDCWFTPIQMKKNRPATQVSILCAPEKRQALTRLLYTETSTLGVRVLEIERDCLPRETVKIETVFGAVDLKIARYNGEIVNAKPEYDQIREIALKSNVSLREIESEVLRKFQEEQKG